LFSRMNRAVSTAIVRADGVLAAWLRLVIGLSG
jgi:hypothetical protein